MTQEQIQPTNDRILIEVLDETQEYGGAIELAPTSKEPSQIAEVKRVYNEGDFTEGDKVIFNRHSGAVIVLDKFNINAPEYRLIKKEDIYAKII